MADLSLKAVFSLIDRISAPIKKITDVTEGLSKGFDHATRAARSMGERIGNAKRAVDDLSSSTKKASQSTSLLSETMKLVSVAAVTTAVTRFVGGIFSTASSFENLAITLETVTGSSAEAKKSLDWVAQFAVKTPYQLGEVSEAFVRLRSIGIDPTMGMLESIGNAASVMNKPLVDGVEAIKDAVQGGYERLKEFNISTQTVGKTVKFTFGDLTVSAQKNSASIQGALKQIFDAKFMGAMVRQSRTFGGLMGSLGDVITMFQLKAAEGGIFDLVKNDLADFLDWFGDDKNKEEVAQWAKNISDNLTKIYEGVKKFVGSIDWGKTIDNIIGFFETANNIANFVGGWEQVFNLGIAAWITGLIYSATGLIPILGALAGALFGTGAAAAVAAFPFVAIIAAAAALAGIAFLVWRNWDKIWPMLKGIWSNMSDTVSMVVQDIVSFFGGLWDQINALWKGMPVWMQTILGFPLMIITHWGAITGFFAKTWDAIKGVFKKGVDAIWQILPDWIKGIFKGEVFGIKIGSASENDSGNGPPFDPRPPFGRPPSFGAAGAAVGTLERGHAAPRDANIRFDTQRSELDINFHNAPSNMFVTKSKSSPNQKTTVNTGTQGPRR